MFVKNKIERKRKQQRMAAHKYRSKKKRHVQQIERELAVLRREKKDLQKQIEAYRRIAKEALYESRSKREIRTVRDYFMPSLLQERPESTGELHGARQGQWEPYILHSPRKEGPGSGCPVEYIE